MWPHAESHIRVWAPADAMHCANSCDIYGHSMGLFSSCVREALRFSCVHMLKHIQHKAEVCNARLYSLERAPSVFNAGSWTESSSEKYAPSQPIFGA